MIAAALVAISAEGIAIEAISRTIATPALGPAGRGFANAAAVIATPLDPPAMLALLKAIERAFGRRRGRRWGQRVLDLDIILWSAGRWPRGREAAKPGALVVPHAAWADRRFVLDPLLDIAAGWRAPDERSVRHAHARLSRRKRMDAAAPPAL